MARDPVAELAEPPMPEVEVRETRRHGVSWVDRVFFDTTTASFAIVPGLRRYGNRQKGTWTWQVGVAGAVPAGARQPAGPGGRRRVRRTSASISGRPRPGAGGVPEDKGGTESKRSPISKRSRLEEERARHRDDRAYRKWTAKTASRYSALHAPGRRQAASGRQEDRQEGRAGGGQAGPRTTRRGVDHFGAARWIRVDPLSASRCFMGCPAHVQRCVPALLLPRIAPAPGSVPANSEPRPPGSELRPPRPAPRPRVPTKMPPSGHHRRTRPVRSDQVPVKDEEHIGTLSL